jgi:single-strand DNA-binding protein
MAVRRGHVVETDADDATTVPGVNEVRLVGRLSRSPESRQLPSGDEVIQLRLVVRRAPEPARSTAAAARSEAGRAARAGVDVIDVSCWSAATRRSALRLAEGDTLEVEGALRRRFYRVGPVVQSRYDVVAGSLRRVKA